MEQATRRGSHDGVHDEQTCEEHAHAAETPPNAAEIGGEEEECKLARSLRTKSMNDPNAKCDRAGVVEVFFEGRVNVAVDPAGQKPLPQPPPAANDESSA
jgi:hypothetical protein